MRVTESLSPWFSPSAWLPRRLRQRPARRRPGRRLNLEQLEDRIAPVTQLDVAGLRFLATTDFVQNGNEHTVTSGKMSIGYTPAGTENFRPLIQADLSNEKSEFIVDTSPGA